MTAEDWSVYLVRCGDGSLYTGIALDVERRLGEHQSDPLRGAKYLRGRGPLELVFEERVGSRGLAQRVEYALKRWPRGRKERLADGEESLGELVAGFVHEAGDTEEA